MVGPPHGRAGAGLAMLDLSIRRRQGDFRLDVKLSAGPGVTALFGRSGSGKSSVINMVAGLARPDEGRIEVAGKVLFDSALGLDLAPEARRLGYVFQDARLFPHLSVTGNLTFGMRLLPPAERRIGFDEVVEVLGIGHLLDRRPAKLSGGERQRVAIGRALLASPRILLMDEPLAALDNHRKAELLPFIGRLARRFAIPILYVSHSMEEVLALADTLVLMDEGQAKAVGEVEDLLSRTELRPLTGRYDAGSVIRATVAGHDATYGMSRLTFSGGTGRQGGPAGGHSGAAAHPCPRRQHFPRPAQPHQHAQRAAGHRQVGAPGRRLADRRRAGLSRHQSLGPDHRPRPGAAESGPRHAGQRADQGADGGTRRPCRAPRFRGCGFATL
jgi:molybdate transport system ATP-binding protein